MSDNFWDSEDLAATEHAKSFWDDDDVIEHKEPKKFDPLAYEASIARKVVEPIGKASEYLSKYTAAPIRSGIDALQHGEGLSRAWEATKNQFGEDPSLAPTGKDIAKNAGLSTEESIKTPLKLNPFTNETLNFSPAGIAGAGIDIATDPLTYAGSKAITVPLKGLGLATDAIAPEVAEYLRLKAAKRAVKAAAGGSDPNMRAILGVPMRGSKDQTEAAFLREGSKLLDEGAAGQKTVGWLSNSKGIGERASENLKTLKEGFNNVGTEVDRLMPDGAVDLHAAGNDLIDFAASIPPVGKGAALQERVLQEAENLQKMGRVGFNEAQSVKGQYPFNPQAADALISDKDVTNTIRSIISKHMDNSVDSAAKLPGADAELLGQYGQMKSEYGTAKNVSGAAADQYRRDVSRRAISPSTYGVGGVAAITAALMHPTTLPVVAAGAVAGGAHQLALKHGPALAANLAKSMSLAAAAAPAVWSKFEPILVQAAAKGTPSLVATHHVLLQNDPEYRKLFDQPGQNSPQPRPLITGSPDDDTDAH